MGKTTQSSCNSFAKDKQFPSEENSSNTNPYFVTMINSGYSDLILFLNILAPCEAYERLKYFQQGAEPQEKRMWALLFFSLQGVGGLGLLHAEITVFLKPLVGRIWD